MSYTIIMSKVYKYCFVVQEYIFFEKTYYLPRFTAAMR